MLNLSNILVLQNWYHISTDKSFQKILFLACKGLISITGLAFQCKWRRVTKSSGSLLAFSSQRGKRNLVFKIFIYFKDKVTEREGHK